MNDKRLWSLIQAFGPTGGEELVRGYIQSEIEGFVDECSVDAFGNLIAHKKGDGKRLMLVAEMDEQTLMITHIDDKGFLRFASVGECKPKQLVDSRVMFGNGIRAIVGCDQLEPKRKPMVTDLYIDLGAEDKSSVLDIRPGDVCVVYTADVVDDTKIITAAPSRLGCFVLMEAIERIKNNSMDLYFVFTVQKAIAHRGAKIAANPVAPDYCIGVGHTVAYDTPKALEMPVKLHAGAAIRIKDAGTLCHPKIYSYLQKTAEAAGIKHQVEILDDTVTGLNPIHMSRGGVPSSAISIPVRHPVQASLCVKTDVESCIELTVAAAQGKID